MFAPVQILISTDVSDVVSCPNYTGSVGFGDKYVRKLLGSIGTLDVEDCIQTVRQLTDAGVAKSGQQFLLGGSHGGFLSAHRKSINALCMCFHILIDVQCSDNTPTSLARLPFVIP